MAILEPSSFWYQAVSHTGLVLRLQLASAWLLCAHSLELLTYTYLSLPHRCEAWAENEDEERGTWVYPLFYYIFEGYKLPGLPSIQFKRAPRLL